MKSLLKIVPASVVLLVLCALPTAALSRSLASSTVRNGAPVPGALTDFRYIYNDSYLGWPVAPVNQQHPIRASFLDPRIPSEQGNYHIGIDISVPDDSPEADAPAGRSHRVYAIEGGVVHVPANQAAVGCVNRIVAIGHFQYWHTDTLETVKEGQQVAAGDPIGWTCKGLWHVHLSEIQQVDGQETYVNPLHPAGKLAPLVDTAPPVIHAVRFFTPAFGGWTITNNTRWSPDAGRQLSANALHGFVDVRAWIGDPQSFKGYFVSHPELETELHPDRVAIKVTRSRDGGTVVEQDVYRANTFLEAALPLRGLPVIFDYHFAPGTSENTPAFECENHLYLDPGRPTCRGVYWLRLLARANGADWDTTRVDNGRYRIEVTAWDAAGNRAVRRVDVTVRNR
jgi:hypothetical protein